MKYDFAFMYNVGIILALQIAFFSPFFYSEEKKGSSNVDCDTSSLMYEILSTHFTPKAAHPSKHWGGGGVLLLLYFEKREEVWR